MVGPILLFVLILCGSCGQKPIAIPDVTCLVPFADSLYRILPNGTYYSRYFSVQADKYENGHAEKSGISKDILKISLYYQVAYILKHDSLCVIRFYCVSGDQTKYLNEKYNCQLPKLYFDDSRSVYEFNRIVSDSLKKSTCLVGDWSVGTTIHIE